MAADVAVGVANEARRLNGSCSYCGHYEDHDTSTMAYHATSHVNEHHDDDGNNNAVPPPPLPIKLVMMGTQHVYWQHGIKEDDGPFLQIWKREQARMAGLGFFDSQPLYRTDRNSSRKWDY